MLVLPSAHPSLADTERQELELKAGVPKDPLQPLSDTASPHVNSLY